LKTLKYIYIREWGNGHWAVRYVVVSVVYVSYSNILIDTLNIRDYKVSHENVWPYRMFNIKIHNTYLHKFYIETFLNFIISWNEKEWNFSVISYITAFNNKKPWNLDKY